jgi:protein-tyrosine phosphatase
MEPLPRGARSLPLPGTFNLRHVGGCRAEGGGVIGDGILWRSDDLHRLDESGRRALAELGIATIIDLRDEAERVMRPSALAGLEVEVIEVPIVEDLTEDDEPEDWMSLDWLDEIILGMLRDCGGQIAAAVSRLARPGALPAIVLCTSGRDRTGVVILTLLSAIGIVAEDIAEDYAVSRHLLGRGFYAQFAEDWEPTDAHGLPDGPEWAMAALALLAAHGGAAAYLMRHGTRPDELDALRRALVA